jgi:hypothetical protein
MKNEEYRFLSGLLLQKVGCEQINDCCGLIEFVEDDGVEDAGEDEELRNDPISQMDMRVCMRFHLHPPDCLEMTVLL